MTVYAPDVDRDDVRAFVAQLHALGFGRVVSVERDVRNTCAHEAPNLLLTVESAADPALDATERRRRIEAFIDAGDRYGGHWRDRRVP